MPGAFSVTSESFQLQILFQFFTVVPIILTTMACTRNGGVLSNINKKKKKTSHENHRSEYNYMDFSISCSTLRATSILNHSPMYRVQFHRVRVPHVQCRIVNIVNIVIFIELHLRTQTTHHFFSCLFSLSIQLN